MSLQQTLSLLFPQSKSPSAMSPRSLRSLAAIILLAGGCLLTHSQGAAQITFRTIPGDPIAVDGGAISGTFLPSGVKAYFGVPFAAPPVRENRWREPQPVQPWQGVYVANRKAPECIQPLRSSSIGQYFGEEATSEDCLYLNLWAPATARQGAKLPVVVYIYGGAYTFGSASAPVYSGEPLAHKGVLYVALNYRVGVMGFMTHPEITAASPQSASGNWGLLDQVAGLQWIARNITSFGGDPSNVTIVGQSAGALSLNFLQASPLAKGLFARILAMSGSAFANDTLQEPFAQAQQDGVKVQMALKASSLKEMRTFSPDKVLAVAAAAGYRPSVVVDGRFLPKTVEEIFKAHEQSDVPVVVGSTADDLLTNIPLRRARTVPEYDQLAGKQYGTAAPEFLKLYPVSNDAEVASQARMVGMSSGLGAWAYSWALHQAEYGRAPAYLFRFSLLPPFHPGVVYSDFDAATAGVFHSADVPYWLGTYDTYNLIRTTRDWRPLDRKVSEEMMDVLVSFARSGNPSTSEVTVPRFAAQHPSLVDFGETTRVESLNARGMEFLASHGGSLVVPPVPINGPARTTY